MLVSLAILLHMVRRFLANLSYLFVINLLIKPLYIFGIEVQVQNVVGAGEYGIYFALLNTAYLLQILNDFGLQIYNNRRVSVDPRALISAFPALLRSKVVLGILFFVALAILAMFLGYTDHFQLLSVIAVNLFLTSVVLFIRSAISGLGFYKQDSTLSVMDKVLMIMFCGALLISYKDGFTIMHFALVQTVSLLLTAISASVFLYLKRPRHAGSVSKESYSDLIRSALPFALAVFLMTAYTRIDAVMIEQLRVDGDYQTGLYAAGYRLLDACNMVAYLFAALLLPMFARLASDREALTELIRKAFKLMWILTIIAATVGAAFRHEIMGLLYREATTVWADTFGILILSFIGVGSMYIFGTFMTAVSSMKSVNIAYCTCILLNIGLNVAFIPVMGAKGAAWATLVTQLTIGGWLAALSVRHLDLRPQLNIALRLVLFAFVAAGTAIGAHYLSELWGRLIWIIPAVAVMISVAFLFGMIRKDDLLALSGK